MNNIELAILKEDVRNLFGSAALQRIDKMNSKQIDELKVMVTREKQNRYPSHRELVNRKKKMRKILKSKSLIEDTVSFVIPYMHTEERYPLLMACLKSLPVNSEKCVVELGKKRKLTLPSKNFKYMFVQYEDVMHRGWALNLGAKQLSTKEKIVLLDADIVLPEDFIEKISDIDHPVVAWGSMYYLTKEKTDEFLSDNYAFDEFTNTDSCEIVKKPRLDGPAGGITMIPRDIFMKIKGVPEDFEGTWGGPDNTLMSKLQAFGYGFKVMNCKAIHLWHSKNTPRVMDIALKARSMMRWSKAEWDSYLYTIGDNWGKIKERDKIKQMRSPLYEMSIKYIRQDVNKGIQGPRLDKEDVINALLKMWPGGFREETLRKVFDEQETILSLAMLSLLRTDKLLLMLDHWNRHRYIPSNIALRVQGMEWLSNVNKRKIDERVEKYFKKKSHIYTRGNAGTGIPRHQMVNKALSFNTPYIMTTDDDMFFPPGSVEAMISLLEDDPSLGAVDMWVHPNLNAWTAGKFQMKYRQPIPPLDFVDGMGSATMVVRREVFDSCNYDPDYYIGWADIDFCMQMVKNDWKIAILALPDFKALNWKYQSGSDYKRYRHDAQHAGNSSVRFHSKWGRTI